MTDWLFSQWGHATVWNVYIVLSALFGTALALCMKWFGLTSGGNPTRNRVLTYSWVVLSVFFPKPMTIVGVPTMLFSLAFLLSVLVYKVSGKQEEDDMKRAIDQLLKGGGA